MTTTFIRRQNVLSLLIAATCTSGLWAECSDSGFCRLPLTKNPPSNAVRVGDVSQSRAVNTGLRASVAQGEQDESLTYTGLAALATWQPQSTTILAIEIPWVRASGDRGSASGLGDILIAANQQIVESRSGTWSASLGLRLPTGDDNALSGTGLAYQPGLGSTDVILAGGWRHHDFDARVGYIAALGRNHTAGIELERGDDVAAAAGYTAHLAPLEVRGGLQVIHRLKNSTATDGLGGRTEIEDSAGTQVNFQLGAAWQASERWNVGLDVGIALMERQKNAAIDGLTRSRSVALQALFAW